MTNVNPDVIRRMLEAEKAKGRSNVEAAGLALWLTNEEQARGILSEQTRQEAEEVILDWLADVGESPDEAHVYIMAAKQLARFLSENVEIELPEPSDLKVERALHRWEEANRRGSPGT
jgi:hypothetical protein